MCFVPAASVQQLVIHGYAQQLPKATRLASIGKMSTWCRLSLVV